MPKEEYIPTPPVGTIVQFFPGGLPPQTDAEEVEFVDQKKVVAAQVTGWHNKPGIVSLNTWPDRGLMRQVTQAYYAGHPDAIKVPMHPNIATGGTWRYLPKDDTLKHKAWLKREEENRIAREREKEAFAKAEEARKKKLEEARLLQLVNR